MGEGIGREMNPEVKILEGDVLERLRSIPNESVHCVVTSPPYWGLRNYGVPESVWAPTHYRPMVGLPEFSIDSWRGCLGLEPTQELYVGHLVQVFREIWRVLRSDGTLWLNLGDSYMTSGGPNRKYPEKSVTPKQTSSTKIPEKNLFMIPSRVALALQADGWFLRSEIVWAKQNGMPESIKDRPTCAHEKIFLFSKSPVYFYDYESSLELARAKNEHGMTSSGSYQAPGQKPQKMHLRTKEGNPSWKTIDDRNIRRDLGGPTQRLRSEGKSSFYFLRNPRNVWYMPTQPFPEAHFAVFPEELPRRAITAGTSSSVCESCGSPWIRNENCAGKQGNRETGPSCRCSKNAPVPATVLDPFGGSGTTGLVAQEMGRSAVLIECSPDYVAMAERRIRSEFPMFSRVIIG